MAHASENEPSIDEREEATDAQARPPRSIDAVLADPTTSYWLRAAIVSLVDRDPVDALNDALVLAALLDERLRIALGVDAHPPEEGDEDG